MKKPCSIILAVVLLIFSFRVVSAQVVINEFSSNTSSDWVELYSAEDVDISGWILDDYDTATNIEVIPSGTSIGPSTSSYYAIEASSRLNKDGDEIYLYDPSNNLNDKITYGDKGGPCVPSDAGSIGRYPDANATIDRFSTHSKGSSNTNGVLDPCPTPTPEPTPAPTPTPTPAPTASPTPTPTKTPSPSPTKTPTPKPTKTPNSSPISTEEPNGSPISTFLTPTPAATVLGESTEKKGSILPYLLIGSGIICLGFAGYLLYNNSKGEQV